MADTNPIKIFKGDDTDFNGGAVDYDKLANLPTFNGKEWKGPLTFASENIASKSELDTLAGNC